MANVTTYSAFTDAQSQNDISRNVRQYRDLDLFFSKKSTSADISKVQGIQGEVSYDGGGDFDRRHQT